MKYQNREDFEKAVDFGIGAPNISRQKFPERNARMSGVNQ